MARAVERQVSERDLKIQSVYILCTQKYTDGTWSRPEPIPFNSFTDLRRHLCDIIAHNLAELDEKPKRRIVAALEAKDYSVVIRNWRLAQMNNSKPLRLDFYWQENPTAIL